MDTSLTTCIIIFSSGVTLGINHSCIDFSPGDATMYHAFNQMMSTELILQPNSVKVSGLLPHNLLLHKGASIVLMRKLDFPKQCHKDGHVWFIHILLQPKITKDQVKDEIMHLHELLSPFPKTLTYNLVVANSGYSFALQSYHKTEGQITFFGEPVFNYDPFYITPVIALKRLTRIVWRPSLQYSRQRTAATISSKCKLRKLLRQSAMQASTTYLCLCIIKIPLQISDHIFGFHFPFLKTDLREICRTLLYFFLL